MWSVLSNSKPGMAVMGVFLGLKGTAKELGLEKINLITMKSNDMKKVINSFISIRIFFVYFNWFKNIFF